ncbi:expressed unknown protein [Seminavis robusta]|uniref:DUF305 domain-containing protein n=1 Tax=Seminavis robusta TaxID=568900 RepID=A0A9N8HX81_9STRA|nr:expressed unknown protein [Seminavis robusta]|eukprot:Sro2408_g326630.1 n/a (440) ;mRNA; r:4392-5922
MMKLIKLFLFLSLCLFTCGVVSVEGATENQTLCVSPNNVFHARVNLYAGELGYYVFEECGLDNVNPTIAVELGETYTFVQTHRSNYFHPIGFAYSPYGDEELKIEVEPGTSRGNQSCIQDYTCHAPMYFINDEYVGHYSNNPDIKNITHHEEDFGLDVYEPLFMRNPHEWAQFGNFTIKLRVDDPDITSDMFIFCHIHEWMAGRIKVTKNGIPIIKKDVPTLGFEFDYNTPLLSDFDKECGTFALGQYQTPDNPHCPDHFVCDKDDPMVTPEMAHFGSCIDAMNCAMLTGMTTGIKAQDERALFIHQMIPHHQNAVNMAKALLKTEKIHCADLANDEDPDCILEGILYEIVNTQNLQIQAMFDYLDAKRFPEADNCEVPLDKVSDTLAESAGAATLQMPTYIYLQHVTRNWLTGWKALGVVVATTTVLLMSVAALVPQF